MATRVPVNQGGTKLTEIMTVGTVVGQSDYVCDGTADDVQIQAAIDAVNVAGGGTVFIKAGTYNIFSTVQLRANINLIGEGWTTILKSKNALNAAPLRAQYSNLVTNVVLKDFKVDMNGPNQTSFGWVALTGITHFTIDHIYFYNSYGAALLIQADGDPITGNQSKYGVIQNCRFDTQFAGSDEAVFNVQYSKIINNYWGTCFTGNYALSAGASFRHNIVANNIFENVDKTGIGLEGIQDSIIIGNRVYSSITLYGNGIYLIERPDGFTIERVVIANNICTDTSNDGINCQSIIDSIIVGNICNGNGRDGISINKATNCNVSNNICSNNNQLAAEPGAGSIGGGIRFSGGTPTYNKVSNNQCFDNQIIPTQNYGIVLPDICSYFEIYQNTVYGNVVGQIKQGVGTTNVIRNNLGTDITQEIEKTRMKNTSGGDLVAGNVVVLKAVAAGNEFTTTTTQGDDLVFGMLAEAIASNAWGYVQTLGKTKLLKVDGTTNIAIGDFIGTFTTAGIGMKAGAGDMAFAIALEAYTTDDSAGVIDALIIKPRKLTGTISKTLSATGSVNGINLIFTFTEKPTLIVSDGVIYRENIGWSWSGLTATMVIPPNDDLFGWK